MEIGKSNPLFEPKDPTGKVQTIAEFEAAKPDPVKLAAELSHQLEEARGRIDLLESANREWSQQLARAEAARDVLKELLVAAISR